MKDKECGARFQINDTVQNVCLAERKVPRLVCKMPSGTNFVRHTHTHARVMKNRKVYTAEEDSRSDGRSCLNQTVPPIPCDALYMMFVFLPITLNEERREEARL